MSKKTINLLEKPTRKTNADDVTSLAALYVDQTLTDDEVVVFDQLKDLETGFTYEEAEEAIKQDVDEDELQGYLGSFIQKGLVERKEYTEEEIEQLKELNEEYNVIHRDDVNMEEYEDVLQQQGGIYVRGKGVYVDETTEADVSHFYFTEDGKEIRDILD